MVWTKLLYTTLPKAFERTRINPSTITAPITARYKALLRKTYRLNGVPWLYDIDVEVKNNPRNKTPKLSKKERDRPLKLAKIEKAIEDVDAKKISFRQDRLNKKKIAGWDGFVSKVLPSLIKKDANIIPKHLRRRAGDGGD